jgi:hypothetical protein
MKRTLPASNFVGTLAANVDNPNMSDSEFRALFSNTLPIVDYHPGRYMLYEDKDIGKGPRKTKQCEYCLGDSFTGHGKGCPSKKELS